MKTKYFSLNDWLWIIPASLVLGALLAFIQDGTWWVGWLGFSAITIGGFFALTAATRWASQAERNRSVALAWIVALAFLLRFVAGVATYLILPVNGYDDEDDKAGYVFTDAHRRDEQAWDLASSEHPILDAFQKNFAYDQYGGLLAFSAFAYRYFSPDAHRPLMLVLLSALVAAFGVPFLWKAVEKTFGERVAWATAWIFALYPESILLGGSAMREPYIMTFSAMTFWGFVHGFYAERSEKEMRPVERTQALVNAWLWLGVGLLGMILVSPTVALFTLIIFAGWVFFSRGNIQISWKAILVLAAVFVAGLFFLSASLNRSGEFNSSSPLHIINDWFQLAVKWDAYQIGRELGYIQKLFDDMPRWMRLPFITFYGILRPVLPATVVDPTTAIWKVIYILRGLGWYALFPMLILSFIAGSRPGFETKRPLWMWISLLAWTWILIASLRGGGDDWDNPRYRALLFVWQALMGGYVWVWWRETRNAWFTRVLTCEVVFLLIFTQWYGSRYLKWGDKLPFPQMVALILSLWALIVGIGLWRDRKRA
ncbi:MAG: hypothetical protein QM730_11200 [Anaerolineales bacterium]